ncbi:MAG: CapA family protein [Lachnospiraceae bacterium]|jgi:poly-gamma-glutamate capsule biosynthesis protein CapA/YwtB (metallophosphatase superfamily)
MAKRKTRKHLRRKRLIKIIVRMAVMCLLIAGIVVAIVKIASSVKMSEPMDEEVIYKPGPPVPAVESSASFAATGDILLHSSVLSGAYSEGEYDFTESFAAVSSYWASYDYMIANLEVACGGEESGAFTGYPLFNAPDSIVTGLKDAGVDMLLTANNHAYDQGSYGMDRTQDVIMEAGLDYIGTRKNTSEPYVLIKNINGIKFGFACYTYDTRRSADEIKSINGITMNESAVDLINSFCYSDLESLYVSVENDLAKMKREGCDVTVFFMHWGDEYTDEPNNYEQEIARELCNLGVDVIIGGHPHVIQRYEVLMGENGNATHCLYSMGNSLSSQRKNLMNEDGHRGYTEDGLTISFAYHRFNNGKVKIKDVSILPLWVDQRYDGVFVIVPLDETVRPTGWRTDNTRDAIDSYNRTLGRVGTAYTDVRGWYGWDPVTTFIEY